MLAGGTGIMWRGEGKAMEGVYTVWVKETRRKDGKERGSDTVGSVYTWLNARR